MFRNGSGHCDWLTYGHVTCCFAGSSPRCQLQGREDPGDEVAQIAPQLDRGQTREICQKQEKCFKGKVVIFTVQRLILYQYTVDLLTYLKLYLKSFKYLKTRENRTCYFVVSAILSGCGVFKSEETRLRETNENTVILNSYNIYPCSCLYLIVNEIS